ncbi:MAG TPA: cation diffusion facilitator family transporter [Dermatophilaceae bacterium]|nr:cation diffusion facilitator family transporter [Dermatophilaceae bacterium]
MASPTTTRESLTRFAWLSIAAALATIALKTGAWWMTGSVGLLSDAAESLVNLAAAVVALFVLRVAARPADSGHPFGHSKAEYFSAAAEGQMIFVAAVLIIWSAVNRFLHPQPLQNVGIGLAVSVLASVINGAVAFVLLRAGRQHRSMTLEADGRHLLTDVWTSAGVVVGVLLVAATGIDRLDPVVALLVGLNIVFTGWRLLMASASGLMDSALPEQESAAIATVLGRFASPEVSFHGLRTRTSGHRGFAEVHVLVPGAWSVQRSHDLVEDVEEALAREVRDVALLAHVEPVEDPRSYDDYPTEVPITPARPARATAPAPPPSVP